MQPLEVNEPYAVSKVVRDNWPTSLAPQSRTCVVAAPLGSVVLGPPNPPTAGVKDAVDPRHVHSMMHAIKFRPGDATRCIGRRRLWNA
jgi:hypothetical protein